MLLQRLVHDDKIGFNYDYMGAAEYEFGATRNGRMALAQAYLDQDIEAIIVPFSQRHGVSTSKPIDVVILARKAKIEEVRKLFTEQQVVVIRTTKETFRPENPKILGWMNVGRGEVEPMLIVRASLADASDRVDRFMKEFIDGLREDLAAKAAMA